TACEGSGIPASAHGHDPRTGASCRSAGGWASEAAVLQAERGSSDRPGPVRGGRASHRGRSGTNGTTVASSYHEGNYFFARMEDRYQYGLSVDSDSVNKRRRAGAAHFRRTRWGSTHRACAPRSFHGSVGGTLTAISRRST